MGGRALDAYERLALVSHLAQNNLDDLGGDERHEVVGKAYPGVKIVASFRSLRQ